MNRLISYPRLAGVTLFALFTLTLSVRADFADDHPRRAQVRQREGRQEGRILNSQLTPAQVQELQADEARIRAEKVNDVRNNGGYLTVDQQNQLNAELNAESRKIYAEKHPGQ